MLSIDVVSSVKESTLGEAGFELIGSLAALHQGNDVIVRDTGITNYRCIRSSFVDQGFKHPFILIEKLTHELLKIEKVSYERIIRMMSHEVNNSVGANVVLEILKDEWNEVLMAVEASFKKCRPTFASFVNDFSYFSSRSNV